MAGEESKEQKEPRTRKKKVDDWELEAPLDLEATLEELMVAPPFKEASDQHGHSETAGTRIPNWLMRRVHKLLEMKGSPYELASDVLRDSIYVGMRILHMRYRMSADWDVEAKMAAVVDASGASRRIRGQFEDLEEGLEDLCRDGDHSKAAEKLSEYILAVIELENDWHRGKVFRLIDNSRVVREVADHCTSDIQKLIKRGGKR